VVKDGQAALAIIPAHGPIRTPLQDCSLDCSSPRRGAVQEGPVSGVGPA
jgi:hypothetical protein